MCVAVPMRIVEFEDKIHCRAACSGVESIVNTRLLPDCTVGDYVLVHAGYAIEKVSPEDAENTLEVFRQLREELGR
jgi:hydrogenase expression/formation protein HypC